MKSITKKFAAIILSAALSISTLALPATAVWETTANGKQWVESDGSIAKSKWLKMKSGNRYYIKSTGLMATGVLNLSEKVNGTTVKNTYYFDKNGVMQTGWQYINKKYYYFDKKTGRAYKNTTAKIGDYTYKFDANGNWDKKVLKNGKDVTSKVDVVKLTGITEKAGMVVIAGQEYDTKAKLLVLNQPGLTDEDLKSLKYFTKLTNLSIVPGAEIDDVYDTYGSKILYDYEDAKFLRKERVYDAVYEVYEAYEVPRNTSIEITNLDFCKYMPKLQYLDIAYAPKLTDLTGLQGHKHLVSLYFFNCTAIKDLHALDNIAFTGSSLSSSVHVVFTDNVEYAFTDYYFGKRLSSICDGFIVQKTRNYVIGDNLNTGNGKLKTSKDFCNYFLGFDWDAPIIEIGYVYSKLKYNIGAEKL